jgi:AraC-like DNA-binding protein
VTRTTNVSGATHGLAARGGIGSERAVATEDVDRARAELCTTYYPLKLNPLSGWEAFKLDMKTMTLGSLTLGQVGYQSDVTMDCGDLRTAYHVNIPLSGEVASSCGGYDVVANPHKAAVFTPIGRTVLRRWTAGCVQLCLKIDRSALENELADRLGHPVSSAVQFKFGFDLTTPASRNWLAMVRMMASEFEEAGGLTTHPILATEVEHLVVAGLLVSQPHNYTDELTSPAQALRPRAVKHVIELIEANPESPWTVTEFARAVGVSVRSLEDGFRRYVGTTPRAYLRDRRLHRVHEELLLSSPGETTVSEIAQRWGFAHLGRFARFYQERFGVAPSETLRR